MRKKIIAMLIAAVMLGSLAGCEGIQSVHRFWDNEATSSDAVSDADISAETVTEAAVSDTTASTTTSTTTTTTTTTTTIATTTASTTKKAKVTTTAKASKTTKSTTKKTTTTTTKASEDEQYEWAKYWKGYAADYARSIGLNVLNEQGGAWDNPIRINEAPGNADIASRIHSRLNRYKNDYGVTYVAFGLTHEYNNRWQLIVYYG